MMGRNGLREWDGRESIYLFSDFGNEQAMKPPWGRSELYYDMPISDALL